MAHRRLSPRPSMRILKRRRFQVDLEPDVEALDFLVPTDEELTLPTPTEVTEHPSLEALRGAYKLAEVDLKQALAEDREAILKEISLLSRADHKYDLPGPLVLSPKSLLEARQLLKEAEDVLKPMLESKRKAMFHEYAELIVQSGKPRPDAPTAISLTDTMVHARKKLKTAETTLTKYLQQTQKAMETETAAIRKRLGKQVA